MPKRGDNIHKRKDGRWEGRYKIGTYANGKTKYKSVYGKTYAQVKEKLKDNCRETASESYATENMAFKELLELWMAHTKIQHKGATEYKYWYLIRKHIIPELGEVKITQLNATMINLFLDKKSRSGRLNREGGLSPTYVKSMMLIIKAALKFAAEEDLCMPLKTTIHKPNQVKKELSILSMEEQQQLENFLTRDMTPAKLGILISLQTGLRIGEVCALSWEDIDLKNDVIYVRHTISRISCDAPGEKTQLILDTPKTKASLREIPIPSRLRPFITEAKKKSDLQYVISEKDNFISPRTYDYRYHQILEKCGLRPVNYHALRHTFATRCIEAGVDVKSLSEILGHANVSITLNTYVHSSMEMKRAQLEKLSKLTA